MVAIAAASGCRDERGARSGPTLADPWQPGNSELDPECTGCEDFADVRFAHLGDVELKVAASLDDPLAQWGECIASFFACWEVEGRPVPECVTQSVCPAPCVAEFRREVVGAVDPQHEIYAFNRVFVDETAPCGPPEVMSSEVAP